MNETVRAEVDPLVGTVLAGRYRVVELLGSGGMGSVYRAEHVHMKKPVAVKVLHRHMTTNAEVVARFEREAVAAGRIEHPNVAAATDFGRLEDGSFYLALEFVEGKSLGLLMDQGAMPPERALRIARQIAAGLAAAHAVGIVHRDLKPDNVLLFERDGMQDFVKVLDFGIAKVSMADADGHKPLTQIGTIFGTPQYMSPEQGQGHTVDGRADLYALGVLLYEMIAGKLPFDADDLVVLITRHVTEPPPPLPASVPSAVSALVLALLAKKPADRVPSAAVLVERIDALLAELGATPAPSPSLVRGMPSVSETAATERPAPPDAKPFGALAVGSVLANAKRWGRGLERLPQGLIERVPALGRPVRVGARVVPLLALVAGGALLVLVGALVTVLVMPARPARHAAHGATSEETPSARGKSDSEQHRELVAHAEAGDPRAITALEALPSKQRQSQDARAIGRGYAATGQWSAAVSAYKNASLQFASLKNDPALLADVRRAMDEPSASEEALRLAAHQLGEKGLDLVWDVWTVTRNKPDVATLNRRARQFLDDSAVREHASRELGLVFDLERAEKRHRCADAKALLPKVGEYGDARLVPILERFKLTRGCGFIDLADCWQCLRGTDEIARAREAAEKRPPPAFTGR